MALVDIRDLRTSFGRTQALAGVDLQLEPGQIVGLMGPNGSGKTTLLKILAGVLAEYDGVVTINGERPGPVTKSFVSYLPDQSFLPDSMTALACVDMFADFFTDFDRDKAKDMIAYFGLDASAPMKSMSKGMREKIQISLAISRQASVYLLDEPISGVDPGARDIILGSMLRNYAGDALLVISTHLVHDIETVVDEVVFLNTGRVLFQSNADDLRSQHGCSIDQLFTKVSLS